MMNENDLSRLSDTAMVLAAGFGTRLRPLTLTKPKPLMEVGGQALLDLALDAFENAGIKRVVVNAHYLGEQIDAHVKKREKDNFILSFEDDVLDTGGGVKNARAQFGDKPFFVMNGDMALRGGNALERMAAFWDEDKMDVLLLLYPTQKAKGFGPDGDFMMEENGRVWRQKAPAPRPYVFISVFIVRPQLYDVIPERVFSNNKIFDLAESRRRLYGIAHDGACYEISTPEDLAEANRLLEKGEGWG